MGILYQNFRKVSNDTPTWFQSTNSFYRRNEAANLRNQQSKDDSKSYDVLNKKRFSLIDWKASDNQLNEKLISKRNEMIERNYSWNVTSKVT